MSPEPIQPRVDIYPKTIDTKWARMKYWLSIFFTFNFSLLIFHCGLDIEDPTPPSPPIWVQKSLPEEWPERGIDAHELGGIFIEWQQNAEHNVSAYLIYRSEYFLMNDSLGDFNLLYRLETGNENSLEYLDSDVLLRRTYCYRLRAEDSAQNLSGYSDSIYYELLPSIINNLMIPNGAADTLNSSRLLSWNYDNHLEMEDYCLTILTDNNDLVLRETFAPGDYLGGTETYMISVSITLQHDRVYKWRMDVSANYLNNIELASSESNWATFLYFQE